MAPNKSNDEPTVQIHGAAWSVSGIADTVAWCVGQTWHQETWRRSAALVHKVGGTSSHYHGQRFDPKTIDLVEDGWTHDHCEICQWTLFESDDREDGEGYRNAYNAWLCTECFSQFVQDDPLNLQT